MSGMADLEWRTYDDFSGAEPDDRWERWERPAPDGSTWRYGDPTVEVRREGGVMTARIDAFTTSHDTVQSFDNVKFLRLSTERFVLPPAGSLAVTARISADKLGGDPHDFRDGVAALHVLDFDSRMVFDLITTSQRIGFIYERRPYDAPDAFLCVGDAPMHCPPTAPGQWHDFTVRLDAGERTARYLVDGVEIFAAHAIPAVPERVQVALGILTIHPIGPGGSTSNRGQGLEARWSDVRVGTSVAAGEAS